ncbi:MAG: S8 family peptidase [Lachnospiraceae bacterium]|nr:S8 family peptidase [Lachnospiraceae bacterium]
MDETSSNQEENRSTLETCRNIILSEDYVDLILNIGRQSSHLLPTEELDCLEVIDRQFAIYHYPINKIPDITTVVYNYRIFPKLYGLQDTTSMEASGIIRLRNLAGERFRGKGVLIGFIDTGIDYTHPIFRLSDGSSKIEAIWDQTIQSGTPPEGFLYGSEYKKEEINIALANENPYSIVPSIDTIGHGTFMAGIAAGSDYPEGDFSGAAPEASIAMVKLKPAKQIFRDYYLVSKDAVCYQETDIFSGIHYLIQMADKRDVPLVILLALGTNNGGHVGSNNLANYINSISELYNIAVVISAGDEGSRALHYQGDFSTIQEGTPSSSAFETIEIMVGEGERGFCAEFWMQLPAFATISLVSPSGEVSPKVTGKLGTNYIYRFLFENTRVSIQYHLIGGYLNDVLIFLRVEEPVAGIWRLRIYPEENTTGTYDIWLPIHEFLSSDTRFLKPNPNITITEPSTTLNAITVSTYNHADDSIYLYSGRGFTRGVSIKPDIAAPGVNVYGPLPENRFGVRTGSSISAAHVAGASAILLSWGTIEGNAPFLNSSTIKSYLIRGASRKPSLTYPNREWGYGSLDLYQSLNILRPT